MASRTHALATSGEVYGWGANPGTLDVLGVGNIFSPLLPVPSIAFGQGVASMALSNLHTCALYVDGGVRCTGGGTSGELGDGLRQTSTSPVHVVGLPGAPVQLALGLSQSFALVDGGIYAWGIYGTVNDAGMVISSGVPVPYFPEMLSNVSHIASGAYHYCAVQNGEAWCWGINNDGELGAGRPTGRSLAQPVAGIDAGVVAVALSENHSCALAGGEVWCWGRNSSRQVWWGSSQTWVDQPFKIVGAGSDIVAIAVADVSTCVLKGPPGARSVMCWGSGALGDGANMNARTQPVAVLNLNGNIERLIGSRGHYCAVVDQELRCWGLGSNVGHGLPGDALTPLPITAR